MVGITTFKSIKEREHLFIFSIHYVLFIKIVALILENREVCAVLHIHVLYRSVFMILISRINYADSFFASLSSFVSGIS